MSRLIGLAIMILGLWSAPAHALTLLSDGWEGTCAEIQARWGVGSYYVAGQPTSTGFPCGPGWMGADQPFFLDTSVKLFGAQSLRFNYVGTQSDNPPNGGGFTDKNFSQSSSEIWITLYYRWLSGFKTGGQLNQVTTKGQYQFMQSSARCVLNSNPFQPVACGTPGSAPQVNGWVFAWVWGNRELWMSAQGIKDAHNSSGILVPYDAEWLKHNVQSFLMPFDQWVCYEAHIRNNTPGNADGLYEQFATNVSIGGPTILTSRYVNRQFLGATTNDAMPSDAKWNRGRVYRQDGLGTMWMDGLTYTTTRLGCQGSGGSGGDTTAPATPTGLQVQ